MKGAIYYEAIAMVIFSHMKITIMLFSHVKVSSFRAKARLVFHWCLYNKSVSYINGSGPSLLFIPHNSDLMLQDGRKKMTASHLARHFVVIFTTPVLCSGRLEKDLLKEGEVWWKIFQTKLLSSLSYS